MTSYCFISFSCGTGIEQVDAMEYSILAKALLQVKNGPLQAVLPIIAQGILEERKLLLVLRNHMVGRQEDAPDHVERIDNLMIKFQ